MNKNFPCICGHKKKQHGGTSFGEKKVWCNARRSQSVFFVDDCLEFVPDNLKYMEQQHDDKNILTVLIKKFKDWLYGN